MTEDLAGLIRALPEEAFREPRNPLDGLTGLERLRWLQQTAYFVWRHGGAARRDGTGREERDRPARR